MVWLVSWGDALLKGMEVLSYVVILFALGLDHVALGCQGLVNDGTGDVAILIYQGKEEDFLAWI